MTVRHSAVVILRIALLAVVLCAGCTQPPSEPETDKTADEVRDDSKTGDAPSVVATDESKDDNGQYVPFEQVLTPGEKTIYEARLKVIPEFYCIETPLGDVFQQLRRQISVKIDVDWPALEDVGLGIDTLVTVELKERNLQTILHRMLQPLELTWIIQEDAIWVTTLEAAEYLLFTRIYDVVDLYEPDYGIDPLIDLLEATVSPDS